jgi:metallophosphoesterase superfamily enzyme
MKAVDTQIAGQRMRIDARRALFWSDENTLLVADLHLGKASLLRQAGTALPSGTTTEGLARLSSLIADYRPQRLLIHPGATLRDGRLSHRFPAFWIGPKRCLLPAFGPLTGLASLSPEQNDLVAILTPGGVVMRRSCFE